MASNFIPMVYAVLKDKGVDTKGMSPDEAVDKYNELIGKTGRFNVESGEEISPKAFTFSRPKTKHHLNHAKEMGLNEKEYIQKSIEFFNSDNGKLYFSDARKRFCRYDGKTGEYAVSSEGRIHTYQIIANKDFERVKRQDKLNERKS